MKKFLILFMFLFPGVALAASGVGVSGSGGVGDDTTKTRTVTTADSGDGSAADNLTFAYTNGVRHIISACEDVHGCNIAPAKTGIKNGEWFCLFNEGANATTLKDIAGQVELGGGLDAAISQDEPARCIRFSVARDRWVQLGAGGMAAAAHALGGASHSADTLSNLNSKVSDATLIDTTDSRLSDSRTPTSHAASHDSGGGDVLATMTGDSGSGGAVGYVPAPGIGDATKFLKGDGTWDTAATVNPVTAAAVIADTAIATGAGGGRGVQASPITINQSTGEQTNTIDGENKITSSMASGGGNANTIGTVNQLSAIGDSPFQVLNGTWKSYRISFDGGKWLHQFYTLTDDKLDVEFRSSGGNSAIRLHDSGGGKSLQLSATPGRGVIESAQTGGDLLIQSLELNGGGFGVTVNNVNAQTTAGDGPFRIQDAGTDVWKIVHNGISFNFQFDGDKDGNPGLTFSELGSVSQIKYGESGGLDILNNGGSTVLKITTVLGFAQQGGTSHGTLGKGGSGGDQYAFFKSLNGSHIVLESGESDGATNVATVIDTLNAFSTDGAKLLAIRNQGTDKFLFDRDGVFRLAETIEPTALADFGSFHTTAANELFFGDGDGVFHKIEVDKAQTVTVAKSGGDFTTIQSAIDSISDAAVDKGYTVLIYPGEYAENVVGKSYVNLVGVGSRQFVVIKGSSGTLYTAPAVDTLLDNLRLELTPTASGAIGVDYNAGGVHAMTDTVIFISSSTNGITAKAMDVGSTTSVSSLDSVVVYTMTGSSAGTLTHDILDFNGSSDLTILDLNIVVSIADVDDDVNVFLGRSTGSFFVNTMRMFINATNASYSGTFCGIKTTTTPLINDSTGVTMNLTGAGAGSGTGVCIDSGTDDATINTVSNTFSVTGFATNLHADVATGDTYNSKFDSVTAADGTTGAGAVNYLGSSAYGSVGISGGGEFTIDTINAWHALSSFTAGGTVGNATVNQGLDGAITAYADYSGTVAGTVLATSAAHGLTTGDWLTQTGTTNYNGVFQITVVDAGTYYFVDTWVADDGASTFHHGSHIVVDQRGDYAISAAFSAASAGINKVFDFAIFKNGTIVTGSKIQRKFATGGDVGAFPMAALVTVEKNDVLYFVMRNITDATNITISEGNLVLTKQN